MDLGAFQTTSLAIALVILVLCLIVVAIILAKTTGKYPPTVDSCPDYWSTSNYLNPEAKCNKTEFGCCSDYATPKSDASGTNCPIKCYNTHQLGTV